MKTFEQLDSQGRLTAFEIENTLFGRHAVCRVIESISRASVVKRPKRLLSWFREEEFCHFEMDGEKYVAWEPYGDSSRYWIGPDPARFLPQTQAVRDAFEAQEITRLRTWIGFLIGVGFIFAGIRILEHGVEVITLIAAITLTITGGYFVYHAFNGRPTFLRRLKRSQ